MPEQTNPSPQGPSPFEITTTSKKGKGGKKGIIIVSLVGVFLILSVIAGVLLVRQNQNIQEKAAYPTCPGGEQCPVAGDPGRLRSCTPPQSDNSPDEMLCALAGRVGVCGGVQYCCPSAGGSWTTNMSACAVATATPTATPVITATPTPTPFPTPTVTPSPTALPIAAVIATPTASPTPTATPAANPAAIITVGTSTPTPTATATSVSLVQTTSIPVPVTGINWPTTVGAGVGIMVIIGAILLAI